MPSKDAATSERPTLVELSSVRDSIAHGHMQHIQRGRLLAAMTHAVSEEGVANITVAKVVQGAGVSRRTFYETFEDCEDCLLAALDSAVTRARAQVLPAYQTAHGAWRERIRTGLVALLGFLDQQPDIARLLIVQWLAAGPRALEYRQQLLERIANAVDEGRTARTRGSPEPPQLVAEGVVGAVASVLHARLTRSQPGALIELTNPLMGMIVLPYLGVAAAHRELHRTVPQASAHKTNNGSSPEDLPKDLNMRFTYRTMRVLTAVASHPGGSNRTIATAAGIGDQGQISKLLMRLRKLNLVENTGVPLKGEPNAWRLTVTGQQVERALHN